MGVLDQIPLDHTWIKVYRKYFTRLGSRILFKEILHACSEWNLFLAMLPSDAMNKRNAMLEVPVVVPTLPSWLLGGWPLKAQLLQKPPCSSSSGQCSGMQCNNLLCSTFLLHRCSNPAAWISAEKAQTLGILLGILRPAVFQLVLPTTKVCQIRHIENIFKFLGQGENGSQVLGTDFSGWLVLLPPVRNR